MANGSGPNKTSECASIVQMYVHVHANIPTLGIVHILCQNRHKHTIPPPTDDDDDDDDGGSKGVTERVNRCRPSRCVFIYVEQCQAHLTQL